MVSHKRAGTMATLPPPRCHVTSSSLSCHRGAKKGEQKMAWRTKGRGQGQPRLLLVIVLPPPRRCVAGEQKIKKMASHEPAGTMATSPPPRRRVASSSSS